MHRGYTLLWRKTWSNPILCESGRKFTRLEAWLYIANVLAAGVDDAAAGLKRGEHVPVGTQEGLPCCLAPALRRWLDPVRPEDPGNGRVRDPVPQVCQRAVYTLVAPARTLSRQPQDQLHDLVGYRRPPPASAAAAVVPVPGDEFAMPAKDCVRSNEAGQFLQHLATDDLAFDCQPPPLVVVEQNPLLPELLPEYPILRAKVGNCILLLTVDPAGENDEQQLPRMQLGLHVPPDAH